MTNSNASSLIIISETVDEIRGRTVVIQKSLSERERLEDHQTAGHKLTVAEGLPIIMGIYKPLAIEGMSAEDMVYFDQKTGAWKCRVLEKWKVDTAAAASLASKNKEKFVPPEPPCMYCGRLLKPETDEVTICAASPNGMDELTALALLTRKEAME